MADFGGNAVSILRGQGAGGAGNGTFAAAVHYALPSGAFPIALASGDFNGDGILDLAVADEEAAGVSLLFGQGAGGVGNGTFTVGPKLAVELEPLGGRGGRLQRRRHPRPGRGLRQRRASPS